MVAPAATYASSLCPEARPAPLSIFTTTPLAVRRLTVSGVIATRRSPGAVSRGTPTISELAVWPSIIRLYLALAATRTIGTARCSVMRHPDNPANRRSPVMRSWPRSIEHTNATARAGRAWQRKFYTETRCNSVEKVRMLKVVSGGYARHVTHQGDAPVQEPALVPDGGAGQDLRPAGRGGLRVCHPMIWVESSRALFAPMHWRKPRCVPANDADVTCSSGIVLRCPVRVEPPLERSHGCRYTHDMAYCIGHASRARRMTSGV